MPTFPALCEGSLVFLEQPKCQAVRGYYWRSIRAPPPGLIICSTVTPFQPARDPVLGAIASQRLAAAREGTWNPGRCLFRGLKVLESRARAQSYRRAPGPRDTRERNQGENQLTQSSRTLSQTPERETRGGNQLTQSRAGQKKPANTEPGWTEETS